MVCARRNTFAFDACPKCPVDAQPISLDPGRKQTHVEQVSKCAVRSDVRIEKTNSKVRLMESILHHLCLINSEQLRVFQRPRRGASNAMCRRLHMLRTLETEPCTTYSQHNPSLPSNPSDSMLVCFMFGLWVVTVRGVVIASPTGVQAGTRKSSRGPILNKEVEGDCGGGD